MFTSKKEQLEALRAPFPPEEIQVREENGIKLHYLEWSTVQERLLEVLGAGGFDMEVGRIFQTKTRVDLEVVTTLRFVDGSSMRLTGFGSADILYLSKDKELPWDEKRWASDSFKSAMSDGQKVSVAKAGVGLLLYSKDGRDGLEKSVKEAHAAKEAAAAVERAEATARALTTCMVCKGQIEPGTFQGKNFADATSMMKAIRAKTNKRQCLKCAEAADGE